MITLSRNWPRTGIGAPAFDRMRPARPLKDRAQAGIAFGASRRRVSSRLREGNVMEGQLANILVQVIAGAIGGTAAGSALKDLSMGKAGDAISGAVGAVSSARS